MSGLTYEKGSIIQFFPDFPSEEMASIGKIMGGTAIVVTRSSGYVVFTELRRVHWSSTLNKFVIEEPTEEVKEDGIPGDAPVVDNDATRAADAAIDADDWYSRERRAGEIPSQYDGADDRP